MDHANPEEGGALNMEEAAQGIEGLLGEEDFEDEGSAEETETEETAEAEDEAEEEEADTDTEESELEDEPEPEEDEPESVDWDALMDEEISFRAADQDVTVTLGELRKGYQRDADYRRKTEQLSQDRQAQEQEFQARQGEIQQQMELTNAVIGQVRQLVIGDMNTPEMQQLRQQNPSEWSARVSEIQSREQGLNELFNRVAGAMHQQREVFTAEQAKGLMDYREAEAQKLSEAVPDWTDEKAGELADYLTGSGFSGDEVQSIMDHRQIVIARKAMLYDQLQKVEKQTKKKVATLPKTTKPGKPKPKAQGRQRKINKTAAAHKKTRTTESAAALIENLME